MLFPKIALCFFALALGAPLAVAQPAAAKSAASAVVHARVDPSEPLPKDNAAFFEKHASFLERGKAGPIGLLFLGDSITAGWAKASDVWKEHYERYQPANFGIGGDSTQHVIWRIENGELDGIQPRVVVLMLGTNNSGTHTAEQIAAADKKIVGMIRTRLPETKVLLLAIFPRGARMTNNGSPDSGTKRMEIIRAVNAELAKLDDGKNVRFLDIGPKFLGPDGKIPDSIMPDQLHLSVEGYKIWAAAMQPLLEEMMK
jgi:lysophospholipase L1-like esterase